VTNNFNGFSINFAAAGYKNFERSTRNAVVFRALLSEVPPVDQQPWKSWPLLFGIDVLRWNAQQ